MWYFFFSLPVCDGLLWLIFKCWSNLHSWGKSYLVMVYNSFCIYWILFADTLRVFLSVQRPSFSHFILWGYICWWSCLLVYFYLKCLDFPFLFEGYFCWILDSVDSSFFFSTWKLLCLSDLSIFWWNICCHLNNFSPIGKVLFLSHCFQGFLSFSVQKFNCLCVLLRISLSLSCLLRCLLRILSL